MITYSPPKLTFFKNPNKKKIWFVEIRCVEHTTGERRKFQYRHTINLEPTEEGKVLKGNAFKDELTDYLKEGWNPFDQTPAKYLKSRAVGFIDKKKNLGDALKECYDIKLQHITGTESPRTYKSKYEHFNAWLIAANLYDSRPEDFTESRAMLYMDFLTKEGKSGRNYNNFRSIIKGFFSMLQQRKLIYTNPFSATKPIRTIESEIVPFQDMELQVIRDHLKANDYNMYVYCQFIFYTLCRPIELIQLQVRHVDLRRGKLNIPAAVSKNRKSRSCNLPPALMAILKEWLKFGSVNDYLFGHGMKTCGDRFLRRNNVTERHRAVLDTLGFSHKISLYSWKYSGVIAAYLAGISIEEIRQQAGHHSIEMTQIYMQKLGLLKSSAFGTVDY